MADPETTQLKGRAAGGTEYSWCKAVPGGTGITALAILLSKAPDFSLLQAALHKLQNAYPILRSKLHFDPKTNAFSFFTTQNPYLQLETFDLSSTSGILQTLPNPETDSVSPFHRIFEHQLNLNTWHNPDPSSNTETDLFFASVYTLSNDEWVVTLRLHTAACDRTSAVALLRKLLALMGGGREKELEKETELSLGIEDMIPSGKANKPFWARGVNMLGYSLNSFRLANLNFIDANSPRSSEVVRLHLPADHTALITAACESREIKLCGALAAAALIAAHASNHLPDGRWAKYGVVTLIDCRSILDPVLPSDHIGFYHSAILNTHDVNGSETLWELARRTYGSYANDKNYNKHFSDMADLNFLMCRAIENPGLTPSGSLRTSLVSVFEDCVMDESNQLYQEMGVKDYVGCGSAHGVGPSIALFHTIRDGQLDCACVYPSPLHSREQMLELVDAMKRVLVDGCATGE
ncbi:uncharacterized protein LOC117920938 [Vitis riparia]|uniref:uncharacterized protein LOC117920938 n=1 Tax=Vitis riparia TaxID=96939 RepID=UPI00155A7D40|nr:uncharacterized protein LOC117920938 [Vitis riparia]